MAGSTYDGLLSMLGRLTRLKVVLALIAPPSALLAAQPYVVRPPHLVSPATTTPRIEPITPATPRILPRPDNDGPHIEAAPVAAEKIVPPDPGESQIQKELQRLQTLAETPRGVSATAQSAQAAWLLGLIYLHGAGVRRDAPQAQLWFERSAQSGREPWAYAGLAWCLIDGCTGPPEPAAAARAIAQLRPQHPARADYLAWVLASRFAPIGAPGVQDISSRQTAPVADLSLLQRSAAAGDTQALIELGMIAVAQKNLNQAKDYFRRAAPQSLAAKANLQELRSRPDAQTLSPKQAEPQSGSANEALAMARKYHRGEGVPANFAEAIRFYRLADARGSVDARRMLELIYSRPQPDGSLNLGWMQQLAHVNPHTPIPSVEPQGGQILQRDPTPLYDLLPIFWRRHVMQISR